MKYISQPPLLLDVHIHKPLLPARTWMDSLLAFFPGLQVRWHHAKQSFYFGLCHFSNIVPTVFPVHASGVKGGYPSCHWDSRDAVSGYKETQFPPRGNFNLKYQFLGLNCAAKKLQYYPTIESCNSIWLDLLRLWRSLLFHTMHLYFSFFFLF